MEFRRRDYAAEEEAYSLPRAAADSHPLSSPASPRRQVSSLSKVDIEGPKNTAFFDPLRVPNADSSQDGEDVETAFVPGPPIRDSFELQAKEWASFKRFLMQRFTVNKMVSISLMSEAILKTGKTFEKSSSVHVHSEELDDPEKFIEEGVQVITRQEYISRLHELKDEVSHAWNADDRVTALQLSIKVARLLMDTSVLQFYPMLFVLAADIMDMLGDMVWERIKQKAEFAEDGSKVCSLPENFTAIDVRFDAKETCTNWFCKIGSIRELLPRIYLELAILPCWRFLLDQPKEILQRLVLMIRGVADPLASAYCRLYMAYRAQTLPLNDIGYLTGCVNDINILLLRATSEKHTQRRFLGKKRSHISLMEPAIEYIMKCIFKNVNQKQIGNTFVEFGLGKVQLELFGSSSCASLVLHHLLKELPTEVVSSNAVGILHLIGCSNDNSFDQCLNYRLLGFKLSERKSHMDKISEIVEKVMEVITQYNSLDEYLKVVDAYVDIILQNQMDDFLEVILEGISKRAWNQGVIENELGSLQSIILRFLAHFKDLEDLFALSHFVEILDVMHGSSRSIVSMRILNIGTRNGFICDPTIIQFLFETSQVLHDCIEFSNVKDDDNQQPARLISNFVLMVDYGAELESHLTFLVECRKAFGSINELKETLVHSSNYLAIKAMKDAGRHFNFIKACIAFSEVTIPSLTACARQLNLYLETAEVALLGGLVSHSDGLIYSAISCLLTLEMMDGSLTAADIDVILSSIQKLCSYLVMVPGNPMQGFMYIPKCIASLASSQSWITPRMRIRIFCAIISLLATLSQNKLPYYSSNPKILGNDLLFFGDPSYAQELKLLAEHLLQNIVDVIQQESDQAARGVMALEACNLLSSSLKGNHKVSVVCSSLLEMPGRV